MDLKGVECEEVDCTEMTQDRVVRRVFVNL